MQGGGKLKALFAASMAMLLIGGATAQPWVWDLPAGVTPPPVPADNEMNVAKVALGRWLFYDADLSINGTMSCASCHGQRSSFTDGATTHPGVHGDPGLRNVPSLLNNAWAVPLNRANPDVLMLEQQALIPILGDDPVEMGMKGQEAEIIRRLRGNACNRRLFRAAFGDKARISMETIAKALASYQRTIISFDTPWDRARAGGSPLPQDAQRGEHLFTGKGGCAACHSGVNFTDNRLHPARFTDADVGAQRATGRAQDRGMFRTTGLRNVAQTGPYWHDGHAKTLDQAMLAHDLPAIQALSPDERSDIIAFLGQLTDEAITRDPRFAVPPLQCEI